MSGLSDVPAKAWQSRTGLALMLIVIAFLVLDGTMKVLELPVVLEASASLGWPAATARPLGIILLTTTALYSIPKTRLIGALLLTAYLGGSVATHTRIGNPLATHILFGVYVGILAWVGIVLRDRRALSLFLGRD